MGERGEGPVCPSDVRVRINVNSYQDTESRSGILHSSSSRSVKIRIEYFWRVYVGGTRKGKMVEPRLFVTLEPSVQALRCYVFLGPKTLVRVNLCE